jgi:hypothetical protein
VTSRAIFGALMFVHMGREFAYGASFSFPLRRSAVAAMQAGDLGLLV